MQVLSEKDIEAVSGAFGWTSLIPPGPVRAVVAVGLASWALGSAIERVYHDEIQEGIKYVFEP
jgi:hypothetical protein